MIPMIRRLLVRLFGPDRYDEGYEAGYRQAERDFETKAQIRADFERRYP